MIDTKMDIFDESLYFGPTLFLVEGHSQSMDESNPHSGKDSYQFSSADEQSPEEGEADEASHLNDVLAALADHRRRYVLHYLQEEQRASLTVLAEQLAAWERDRPVDEVTNDTRSEMEIALYHRHLPQLREADMIDYDEDSEMVVFQEPSEVTEHFLEQDIQ